MSDPAGTGSSVTAGSRPSGPSIAGDSAGGHLSVDLLLQPDVVHPSALVLLSPVVDLTLTLARTRERLRRDPAIRSRDALRLLELYCAGIDSSHPRLKLDVAAGATLPPTLIQAAGRDAGRRRDRPRRRHPRRRTASASCRSGQTRCTSSRRCQGLTRRQGLPCGSIAASSRKRCAATPIDRQRGERHGTLRIG